MDINFNKLARQLWPYLQPLVEPMLRRSGTTGTGTGGGVVGGAPSPHALNSAHHTGTLGDGQAPQFLKTNGSRQLTGNLGVAPGVTIDGVDLSAHAANADAHHNRQHSVTSTADHTASGLTAGQVLRASAPTVFDWAQLQHSDLGGVTANQHHNQVHGITGTDHTVTGDQYDLVGLSAANALGLLASANDVGTSPALRFLRSTGSGGLTLATLGLVGNLSFTGARSVTSNGSNNLTLAPGGDLVLDPTGNVQVPNAQAVQTTSFSDLVTGISGMRLWDRGSNYRQITTGAIKADEIYARAFVVDETRLNRGEEYWSKSYGYVEQDFTIPSDEATVDVWFEEAPGLGTLPLFAPGDWLLFRLIDWQTGIDAKTAWFEVVDGDAGGSNNYIQRADQDPAGAEPDRPDRQQWRLRRKVGGTLGRTVKRGTVALNAGQVGQGWIHLSALKEANGPFIQMGSQTSAGTNTTAPVYTNYVRMGNLNGVGGIAADTWGFAAAKNLATSIGSGFEGFVLDPDNGLRLFNTDLSLYNGATLTTDITRLYGLSLQVDTGLLTDTRRNITWYNDLSAKTGLVGSLGVYKDSSYVRADLIATGAGVSRIGEVVLTATGTSGSSTLRLTADGLNKSARLVSGTVEFDCTDFVLLGSTELAATGAKAKSNSGFLLEDDGGNLGVFVKDGGDVGIGTSTTVSGYKLTVNGKISGTALNVGESDLTIFDDNGTPWTPVITGSVSDPTMNYTTQGSYYTRVNNTVFYHFTIVISSISGGSGNARFSLPFTAANDAGRRPIAAAMTSGVAWPAGAQQVVFRPVANAAYGNLVGVQGNAAVTMVAIADLAAGDTISVSGLYYI